VLLPMYVPNCPLSQLQNVAKNPMTQGTGEKRVPN
jgi:hypothetical protein